MPYAMIVAAHAEITRRMMEDSLRECDPRAWRRMMAEREMQRPGPSRQMRRLRLLNQLFAPLFALAVVLALALLMGVIEP